MPGHARRSRRPKTVRTVKLIEPARASAIRPT
jgi:hypothetical protein